MLAAGLAGELAEWRVDLGRMDAAADLTAQVVREAYPDLKVPFHARWRHFAVNGRDLWAERKAAWASPEDRARAEFDLAITSVLLDAGAGAAWRYRDAATGQGIGRSEGLAIASLDMFAGGLFSADARAPFRVDADVLAKLPLAALTSAFQASDANPL